MNTKTNIFIGYDSKEISAFHVLFQSIVDTVNKPVSIIPLKSSHLNHIYNRTDNKATTEFSLTRFLVPHLSNFEGYSIFMDCDMLCYTDINSVFNYIANDPDKTVYVCKHDYISKVTNKATGTNENYPKKNWSSFMVFNNKKCAVLTPEYVNTTSPADLHRLNWTDESQVGSLPLEFNWLVGEYEHNNNVKIVHYTLGSPCFKKYQYCDYSDKWFEIYNKQSQIQL